MGKLLLNKGFVGLDTVLGSGFSEEMVLLSLENCLGVFTVPTQCHSSGDSGQNEESEGKLALPGTACELCAVAAAGRAQCHPLCQNGIFTFLLSWESWGGLDGKGH